MVRRTTKVKVKTTFNLIFVQSILVTREDNIDVRMKGECIIASHKSCMLGMKIQRESWEY